MLSKPVLLLVIFGAAVSLAAAAEYRFAYDAHWWGRHVPLTVLTSGKTTYHVIVDTGGYGETKQSSPNDFKGYYSGLPIDAVVGADALVHSAVTLGNPRDSKALTARIKTAHLKHELYGFLEVSIASRRYNMLFDTGALAWSVDDLQHLYPHGVSYLRSSVFQELHRSFPKWKYSHNTYLLADDKAQFKPSSTLIVPRISIDGNTFGPVEFVERLDDTTYSLLAKTTHLVVSGDLGLAALEPTWITLDYTRSRVQFGRSR